MSVDGNEVGGEVRGGGRRRERGRGRIATHREKVMDDATWAVPCYVSNKYGCVTSNHRSLSEAYCAQVALRNLDTLIPSSMPVSNNNVALWITSCP